MKGRRVVEGQTDGKGRLVLVQKFAIVMRGANFCEPTICESASSRPAIPRASELAIGESASRRTGDSRASRHVSKASRLI